MQKGMTLIEIFAVLFLLSLIGTVVSFAVHDLVEAVQDQSPLIAEAENDRCINKNFRSHSTRRSPVSNSFKHISTSVTRGPGRANCERLQQRPWQNYSS